MSLDINGLVKDAVGGTGPAIFADRADFQRQSSVKTHPYQIIVQSQVKRGGEIQVRGYLPEQVTFDVSAQYEAPYAQGLNGYMPFLGQVARAMGVSLVTQAMTAQVWQGSTELNFQIPIVFQAQQDAYLDVIKPIKDLLLLTMPRDPDRGGLLQSPGPHITIEKLKSRVNAKENPSVPTPQQGHVDKPQRNDFLANRLEEIPEKATALVEQVFGVGKEIFQSIPGKMQSVLQTPTRAILPSVANGLIDFTAGSKSVFSQVAVEANRQLVNAIENNISLYIGEFLYFPSVVITDVSQAYDVLIAPDKNPSRATVNVSFRTFYLPTEHDLKEMFTSGRTRDMDVPNADIDADDTAGWVLDNPYG
jgi:hypothetical protein